MYQYILRVVFKSIKRLLFCLCLWWGSAFVHAGAIQKIETPHFNIGFEANMANRAQHIANTLETIYAPVAKTLGCYPSPIRLYLSNQSAESNGYFSIAPRHIFLHSLYSSNPHFIGNIDWLSFLCLHEFRHAVQYSTQYHCIPLLLKPIYILGHMIPYVGVPRFFSEGDAIGIETALSESGRGRLPGWDIWYKIALLEGEPISFGQQLFGSVHHRLPTDYYVLGYYLSTYLRRKYGAQAIQSIYTHSIRFPFFGFYHTVKSIAKKSLLHVYREMNEELLRSWQKQLADLPITPATQLARKAPTASFDYLNPFMDATGKLMAWKTGMGVRMQLVQLRPHGDPHPMALATHPTQERRILYCLSNNSLSPAAFAIGEHCAAWLEACLHPWKGKSTMQKRKQEYRYKIRMQYYDFKTKKRGTIVENCRYNALAIAPNGHHVAAVGIDDYGQHHLAIIACKNGKIIQQITHPEGGYYLTPSWCDETHIVVISTKAQQNSIVRIHVATGAVEILLPSSYEHRSAPKIYEGYLLYNSSYNGIDNIYALHLATQACFQVTSRKYGAYLSMVDRVTNTLIFSDCAKQGINIVSMPFNPQLWTPLAQVPKRSLDYHIPLVAQECAGNLLSKVGRERYPIKPFCFGADGLHITGIQSDYKYGFLKVVPTELVSLHNHFRLTPYLYGNVFTTINYLSRAKYKRQDKLPADGECIGSIGTELSHKMGYPIVDMDLGMRWYKNPSSAYQRVPDRRRLALGISLPYCFTLDSSSGSLWFNTTAIFRPSRTRAIDWSQAYRFTLDHGSTKSNKDIYPPWYQALAIEYKHRLTEPTLHRYAEGFELIGQGYFPGVKAHHYMGLQLMYTTYRIQNQHHASRGYSHVLYSIFPKWNYGLPLCYPECGLPLIWFINKIALEGYIQYKLFRCSEPLPFYVKVAPSTCGQLGDWVYWCNGIGIQCTIYQQFFSITDRNPPPQIIVDIAFVKTTKQGIWRFQPRISFTS